MPNETLTPAEIAVLLAFMAEAREISNKELDELHGFTVTGGRRTKLNDLKLVESRKQGQMFVHELTDRGWARCREELSAGRPKGARGTANGALYAVLAGLARFLDRDELTLAYVFQRTVPEHAVPGTDPTPEPTPTPTPTATASPAPAADDLEARIRNAYTQLAKRSGDWVKLSALRELLGGAAKADVDTALKQMNRARTVSVIPEENQKTLTSEDRAAALKLGGKDNHLMKIEDV
jgi:hypothetical protein